MARFGIFYFSGTGNSLYAAKKLETLLPDAELVPVGRLSSPADTRNGFETILFVFPVNFLALPVLIRDVVKTADFGLTRRFYAVATHGGDPGNALWQLGGLLRKKGRTLSGRIDLPMGDNSVVLRTPAERLAQRISRCDSVLSAFAFGILNAQEQRDASRTAQVSPNRFRLGSYALGKTYELLFDQYFHSREGHADGEKCTGCAVCAKVCPASNIEMTDGKAVWGKKCADCFACINRCPQNAVYLGRIHPRNPEAQYRGPLLMAERINA